MPCGSGTTCRMWCCDVNQEANSEHAVLLENPYIIQTRRKIVTVNFRLYFKAIFRQNELPEDFELSSKFTVRQNAHILMFAPHQSPPPPHYRSGGASALK